MAEPPELPPMVSANASDWIRVAMRIRCIRGPAGLAAETGLAQDAIEDRLGGRRGWTTDDLALIAARLAFPFTYFAQDRASYAVHSPLDDA